MELRQLEYFVAVAEARSFTVASQRVHVVQSAVSSTVRSLERSVGTPLLRRTTRRVELTDAGEVFLTEARRVLAAAAAAQEAARAAAEGTRGTVRIGVVNSLLPRIVTDAISSYSRARPDVRLLLRTDPQGSAGLARAVADGDLDLAFAATDDLDGTGYRTLALRSEAMQLICAREHRYAQRRALRPATTVDEPFVDLPAGWGSRAAVDRLYADHGHARNVVIEVGDITTVAGLVRAGAGVAIVVPSSVSDPTDLVFVGLRPAPRYVVSMVTPAGRTPGRAAADLIATVRAARLSAKAGPDQPDPISRTPARRGHRGSG